MPAPWQPPDLDEIHWDRFVVNNEKVRPFLRGAGEREGVFFQLTDWRREGWIARLRAAGFKVRTLADRVAALPAIRRDLSLGPAGVRSLATSRERIASWDPGRLRWRDLPVESVDGAPAVRLRVEEPLRRRKSRSGGDFFIAILDRPGRIGLRPVEEADAILQAYGLLASTGCSSVLPWTETPGGSVRAPDQALLPEPHREALQWLADDGAERWTFEPTVAPLAERVFVKLGFVLDRQCR